MLIRASSKLTAPILLPPAQGVHAGTAPSAQAAPNVLVLLRSVLIQKGAIRVPCSQSDVHPIRDVSQTVDGCSRVKVASPKRSVSVPHQMGRTRDCDSRDQSPQMSKDLASHPLPTGR